MKKTLGELAKMRFGDKGWLKKPSLAKSYGREVVQEQHERNLDQDVLLVKMDTGIVNIDLDAEGICEMSIDHRHLFLTRKITTSDFEKVSFKENVVTLNKKPKAINYVESTAFCKYIKDHRIVSEVEGVIYRNNDVGIRKTPQIIDTLSGTLFKVPESKTMDIETKIIKGE